MPEKGKGNSTESTVDPRFCMVEVWLPYNRPNRRRIQRQEEVIQDQLNEFNRYFEGVIRNYGETTFFREDLGILEASREGLIAGLNETIKYLEGKCKDFTFNGGYVDRIFPPFTYKPRFSVVEYITRKIYG